jgi:hypothetical protein
VAQPLQRWPTLQVLRQGPHGMLAMIGSAMSKKIMDLEPEGATHTKDEA